MKKKEKEINGTNDEQNRIKQDRELTTEQHTHVIIESMSCIKDV